MGKLFNFSVKEQVRKQCMVTREVMRHDPGGKLRFAFTKEQDPRPQGTLRDMSNHMILIFSIKCDVKSSFQKEKNEGQS